MSSTATLRRGLLFALLAAVCPARAGDLLRGGAATLKRNPTSASDAATASATDALRSNAKDALSRTTGALSAIRAMQDAARNAAKAGANNLGADPNHPGATLPNVPDGLGPGGLLVDPAVQTNSALWSGASRPTQSGTTVNITQTQQQAVLNWRSFNIGKNTTLNFDQSAGGEQVGEWIAFNKVNDPKGVPSQILGSIKAQGQVYIINQNGIIFGGSSQVNVHTLVASSLPINDNLISAGLLNNPDQQFLFSSIALPAGAKGTPAFNPPAANTPDGRSGDVVVQPGAQISAPTTSDHVGGRVMLVGPNVKNSGTISTPDGQTILAAGLQVGVEAHSSSDASLRGLDVYIGAVADATRGEYGGTATNDGLIEIPRGNATIAGKTVNQNGGIDSSTSVSLNGRIDLLANYNATPNSRYDSTNTAFGLPYINQASGTVTVGAGSVMQILPEWSSTEKAVGTKLPILSQVNMQGQAVHLGADSTLFAPNANVTVAAGVWSTFSVGSGLVDSRFVKSSGQVYIDSGAMINVAGSTDVLVAMAEYILSVELRGAELADSPVQRTGALRGPELTVDLRQTGTYNGKTWYGTPLADLSGYVGLIQRTAGELTVDGGSVSISAGESVVMQKGSIVDVSGGFMNYQGGWVQTSRVLQGGNLIDVSKATPDQVYDGLYTGQFTTGSSRWGVTKTYSVPWMSGKHYEQDYVQGANGGKIDIQAPAMALDGEMRGNTVAGPRQREVNPQQSSLALKFTSQQMLTGGTLFSIGPTPPTITFQNGASLAAADAFALDETGSPRALRDDRKSQVVLSPELMTKNGFGSLTVENSDGDVVVPANVELVAPPAGSITLSGKNIAVLGSLKAPAGSITLKTYNVSPYLQTLTSEDPVAGRGTFTLGAGSSIDVAGLLIDDRLNAPAPFTQPLGVSVKVDADHVQTRSTLAGGSVSIETFNADLAAGSMIDASGGVLMNQLGKLTYGNGGSISIKAGKDLNHPSVLGGTFNLGSTLRAYSGAQGGSLTLQAQLIQIGGAATYPNTLLLQPEFFSTGGFTKFTLIGIGADLNPNDPTAPEQYAPAIAIAPGTVIEPVAESLLAIPNPGDSDTFALTTILKPVGYRSPVSLSFQTVPGVQTEATATPLLKVRSDIVMGAGARIKTDPLGSVSFEGQTVSILGSVIAPGGAITVSASDKFPTRGEVIVSPTVYLGPGSQLSTAGTTVNLLDPFGRNTGYVLPGGSIKISGNIVADAGALLDVSGTSAVLDVHPSYLNLDALLADTLANQRIVPLTSGLTTPLYQSLGVPTRIDSNGGTIAMKGGEFLFTRATLKGEAGGPTATGGTLSVSSGRFGDRDDKAINLVVSQDASMLSFPTFKSDKSPIGQAIVDANGTAITAVGYFGANSFLSGGFDSLTLDGNVEFRGPVDISARGSLKVGLGGIIMADSTVNLAAPYVAIGRPFTTPMLPEEVQTPFFSVAGTVTDKTYFPPTYGTGVLNIRADNLDIGTLSLQTIGTANFYAKNDIRGNGTFNIAGNLTLTAGQVYPTTASTFTIVAYDYAVNGVTQPGSVTIASSGVQRSLPLSAGGTLNIYGSIINQGGVLRAPIGSINLGWDGTGTAPVNLLTNAAVPITQQLTLSAGSITSVSAVDPVTGQASLIPYGLVVDSGASWIDPTGLNITAGGITGKSIKLSGASVTTEAGSLVDISGGGDLMAYSWVKGNGGSTDILASSGSFAVIPGYDSNVSPYAPFSSTSSAFSGDPGYVNSTIQAGDRVYLSGSGALAAGVYTLLPARYALMPGAVLVTPKSGNPVGTFLNPDGSYFVNGYRFNDLNSSRDVSSLYSRFEVASYSVVSQRATYERYYANTFLKDSAIKLDSPVPRLPIDGGYLLFSSTQAMSLQGDVYGMSKAGGRGGQIDISTPIDIVIGGAGASGQTGKLVLDSALVSRWGAESILIGGYRTFGRDNTTVKVTTSNITVDNAGTPLAGPEIILAATKTLTLTNGAQILQSGSMGGAADLLIFGDAAVAGSGNGTMLRVSSDPNAQIFRNSVTVPADFPSQIVPKMTIGAGATVSGQSIILDSTYATSLDASASILGSAISLNSGRISIQLDNPGALNPTVGLVLSGSALAGLQNAQSLSLLSYTTLDIYGTGQFTSAGKLALHAGSIRGFNNGGGQVTFTASDITLDNSANAVAPTSAVKPSGTLAFVGNTIRLGQGTLNIDQYASLLLTSSGGIIANGTGLLVAQGDVTATSPVITAEKSASHGITAGGALSLLSSGTTAGVTSGLGASLTFTGASVTASSDVLLPSGLLKMQALTGDVTITGRLDVGGTAQVFYDLIQYTDAGTLTLAADNGSVKIGTGGVINVAAHPDLGNAGTFTVSAPKGSFVLGGTVSGQGGTGGKGGSFDLDTGTLASFSSLTSVLNSGSFTESRTIRVHSGNVTVDGVSKTKNFVLSTDGGSITVTGTIDASGATGGTIDLKASGSVTLNAGAILDASAQTFSNAGKGGAVYLEAGSEINGVINTAALVDVKTGSLINLSVASNTADSAKFGQFTGVLHIRAPQVAAANELQINPINGTILGASKIEVEGYKLYDITGSGVIINTGANNIQTQVKNNGNTFGAAITNITSRILANNAGLSSVLVVMPGAEIINRTGNITLGSSASSPVVNDWNLATYRFGPNAAPGVLTLKAAGDVVFYNALSDGFDVNGATSTNALEKLWTAPLLAQSSTLPVNAQSWSYRITSGADFSGADFRNVMSLTSLSGSSGSILIGQNAGQATVSGGSNGTTRSAINPSNSTNANTGSNRFQVIRTGSGDITVTAARDVQLLNQFATIYTAGTQVASPTTVWAAGDFTTPIVSSNGTPAQTGLGALQQNYFAQYSMAGGNVNVTAGSDIKHLTKDTAGNLILDSSRQLPENWLYRRGYVDPATGQYGNSGVFQSITVQVNDPSASTSWWVDFSNFFSGVGALGGGDVTLKAGRDIQNVDAHTPTNARAPSGTPDASKILELGGGDLTLNAGRNIDGGVYYVERGTGTLKAGGSITTNSTRSPSLGRLSGSATPIIESELTWLPTTLFAGKTVFNVSARGDVLLGPVANVFWLPQGLENRYWYKTYFSTYGSTSAVNVSSIGGNVTLRESASINGSTTPTSLLRLWEEKELLLNSNSAANYQPWLRLSETSVGSQFDTLYTVMPSSLRVTAFSGDVNITGDINLFPSATGTLQLIAGGAINGLTQIGTDSSSGQKLTYWTSSTINVSDANPASIPGVTSPYAYYNISGKSTSQRATTTTDFLSFIKKKFIESGSSTGAFASIQSKQNLHAAGPLHSKDTDPVRLYSSTGSLSGLTLFSPKAASIFSGQDITDVSFYIQNVRDSDVSVVSSARDIVLYNPNSPLRVKSQTGLNRLASNEPVEAGDIQISGPGTLEVLAGRNLDLGSGANNPDGTGVGIVSIGNARNPYLPFDGSDIIVAAGLGVAGGLNAGGFDFDAFISTIIEGSNGSRYLSELTDPLTVAEFKALSLEEQRRRSLSVFFLALRDAGRDHNDTGATYDAGFAAIKALFPKSQYNGDISLTAREIKTRVGGDISILAPGGKLSVGIDRPGGQSLEQGILTERGGSINIFANGNVDLGTSRIFTLRGGDIMIWSSTGNIAAGASSKTVQSAPPTRVIIDPQSGNVQTDLSGLATGGGIGVLDTVAGIAPGNVDLIAPVGVVDAGDAGIRSSGNLNIAATAVLNASNIAVAGTSTGTPSAPAVSAPNIGGLAAASSAAGSNSSAADTAAKAATKAQQAAPAKEPLPSIINVEVIGYGGGEGEPEDDEEKKKRGASQ